MKDLLFLGQKAEPAAKDNIAIAEDLLDTLRFHREHCVGMAANMIGDRKAIIAIAEGNRFTEMLNPEVVKKSPRTYKTSEGAFPSLVSGTWNVMTGLKSNTGIWSGIRKSVSLQALK